MVWELGGELEWDVVEGMGDLGLRNDVTARTTVEEKPGNAPGFPFHPVPASLGTKTLMYLVVLKDRAADCGALLMTFNKTDLSFVIFDADRYGLIL